MRFRKHKNVSRETRSRAQAIARLPSKETLVIVSNPSLIHEWSGAFIMQPAWFARNTAHVRKSLCGTLSSALILWMAISTSSPTKKGIEGQLVQIFCRSQNVSRETIALHNRTRQISVSWTTIRLLSRTPRQRYRVLVIRGEGANEDFDFAMILRHTEQKRAESNDEMAFPKSLNKICT